MEKVFPRMYSKPEKKYLVGLIPCWLWVFVALPMFMPYLGVGLWQNPVFISWLEVGYHVTNGIIVFFVMREYLQEEWFMVSTDARHYLKHIALTVVLMLGAEFLLLHVLPHAGLYVYYMLEGLPVIEMHVSHTPLSTVLTQPIFGTIAVSVFVPVSISILFYSLGFAPLCGKKPWLAYLCIALVTLIPPVVNILWRGDTLFVLTAYIINLPVHLLACWSYQKTDNVWTPIISLGITNLITSILLILLIQ